MYQSLVLYPNFESSSSSSSRTTGSSGGSGWSDGSDGNGIVFNHVPELPSPLSSDSSSDSTSSDNYSTSCDNDESNSEDESESQGHPNNNIWRLIEVNEYLTLRRKPSLRDKLANIYRSSTFIKKTHSMKEFISFHYFFVPAVRLSGEKKVLQLFQKSENILIERNVIHASGHSIAATAAAISSAVTGAALTTSTTGVNAATTFTAVTSTAVAVTASTTTASASSVAASFIAATNAVVTTSSSTAAVTSSTFNAAAATSATTNVTATIPAAVSQQFQPTYNYNRNANDNAVAMIDPSTNQIITIFPSPKDAAVYVMEQLLATDIKSAVSYIMARCRGTSTNMAYNKIWKYVRGEYVYYELIVSYCILIHRYYVLTYIRSTYRYPSNTEHTYIHSLIHAYACSLYYSSFVFTP